jgi:hypothetical protein
LVLAQGCLFDDNLNRAQLVEKLAADCLTIGAGLGRGRGGGGRLNIIRKQAGSQGQERPNEPS